MPNPAWQDVFEGNAPEERWTKKNKKGRKLTDWEVASMKWPERLYFKHTPEAVREVNQKFPIKKSVYQETGWDQFKNTLSKGWSEFARWADKHLGPLKGLINLITPFVPFGPVIKGAIEKVVGTVDKALGGKGQVGDMNLYDVLFIYRNCIVALLFKLANDYKVPVDTAQFKKLFHTTPEFKQYLMGEKGGEFVETIVKAEAAAQKVITGNDAAEVPHTRKEAQEQASELIRKHESEKGPDGQPMVTGKKDMYKWLR